MRRIAVACGAFATEASVEIATGVPVRWFLMRNNSMFHVASSSAIGTSSWNGWRTRSRNAMIRKSSCSVIRTPFGRLAVDPLDPPGLCLRLGVEPALVQPETFSELSIANVSPIVGRLAWPPSHRRRQGSGNDLLGEQGREEIVESLFGILIDMETKFAAQRHVGHHLDRSAHVEVGVPWGGHAREIGFDETVFDGHFLPDSPVVRHLAFQGDWGSLEAFPRNAKPFRDARPQPAPSKDVAVNDVVGLVLGDIGGARPDKLFGEHARIGHVREAVPLRGAARELEWPAKFFADRSIGGERGPHVHRVADRFADDRMGAVHAPGETIAISPGVEFVLLAIIEVGEVQTRLLLPQRRRRRNAATDVSLEGAKVVLQASDQGDMLDASRWRDRLEHGSNDPCVDFNVFFLSGAAGPGGQIDVARFYSAHRLGQARGIDKVGANMFHTLDDAVPTARDAVNAGASIEKFL